MKYTQLFEQFIEESSEPVKWTKKSLLDWMGDEETSIIQLFNGTELKITNPGKGHSKLVNKMWRKDSVIAIDQEGDEVVVKYGDIDGIWPKEK
jgi:hypothetical protein